MSNTIFLSVASIFYLVLIEFIFFKKKKVKTVENTIYSLLLIITTISLISEIAIVFIPKDNQFLLNFGLKFFLVWCVIWVLNFIRYNYAVITSKNNNDLTSDLINNKIYLFVSFVVIALTILLPIHYFDDGTLRYSYGPSVSLVFGITGIFIFVISLYIITHLKQIKNTKYIPVIIFVILLTIEAIVQSIHPELLFANVVFAFITTLMYFTIENPDEKLIKEVQMAKKISDDSNYEKSLFLFNMTQDIRMPISDINKHINKIYGSDDINIIKDEVREIDVLNKELYNIVNSILDISQVDTKEIKVTNNKYNIKNLLKEVITLNKKNASEKKLDFWFNVDKSLPEYLYGDSIKLKQILNKLLNNAIKYTERGFISLNVTSIIKSDICRLIIYVEDSGIGIEAERINKVLNNEIDDLTDDKLTISEIQKMLNVIGGTIIVNSEFHKGTKFTIVLDQKIDNDVKSEELEIIDKYKNLIINNKRVLLVDDNESSIKIITKLTSNFNIDLDCVTSGKECLDKIRNKEKYDLILMDEEMPKLSGYDTMKKLQEIHNFNTKVILLTKDSNLEFSNSYLNYGFVDLLVKPVNKNNLTKIYDKYLK